MIKKWTPEWANEMNARHVKLAEKAALGMVAKAAKDPGVRASRLAREAFGSDDRAAQEKD